LVQKALSGLRVFEYYRRDAQEEEKRKPQPVKTTWAIGSMERLAEFKESN
jgi:hypothetical protein